MKFTIFIPILALLTAPLALADHHEEKKPATPAAKPDVKITIEGNDMMQFNKKEFEVASGKVVELTLSHTGKLPKLTMGHNIVILKPGTDVTTFAMAAMQAKATDYIPADAANKAKVVAHTKVIGGGKKSVITFTAPAAGSYDFICTFPGHFSIMKGKMIVK